MWRTLAVAAVFLTSAVAVSQTDGWLGPWGQTVAGLGTAFVISAIVPGYFYREEPWPWRPWRRDGADDGSARDGANGSASA
jgi:hypothetical protein